MAIPQNLRSLTPLLLAGLLLDAGVAHGQTVNFPDPNLEAAVLSQLNQPSGPVTETEMLTLTSLSANFAGIVDTTGLEYASNLTYLQLSADFLTNFSGIVGLTNLTQLDLSTEFLTNASFLTNLPHLRYLSLFGDLVSDYTPLAQLTTLTNLILDGNNPTNAAELGSLINLTSLQITQNGLTNISFLSPLWQMQQVQLDDNAISDLAPLGGLTNLNFISLGADLITNLPPLPNLTNLLQLEIGQNPLSDVSGLTNLAGLQVLGLSSETAAISSLWPLNKLTNLDNLDLSQNSITNVDYLYGLSKLSTLYLQDNEIANVGPLRGLTNLTSLYLFNNVITNIDPLTNLLALQILDVSTNDINFNAGFPAIGDISTLTNLDPGLIPGLTYLPQNYAVTITQQPASRYVGPGVNVTFQVAAASTFIPGDLTYKWFLNGADLTTVSDPRIIGANTSTLTINNVATTDSGPLYVLVTDGNGDEVDSDTNMLSVVTAVPFPSVNLKDAILQFLGLTLSDPVTPAELAGLGSLQVSVQGGGIALDLSGLQYAYNLTNFSLTGDDSVTLTNAGALAALTQLQQLTLDDFIIGEPTFLQNLTGLQYLELVSDQITNINPVWQLRSLGQMNVNVNYITNFLTPEPPPVSAVILPNLTNLNASANYISDASFIQGMPALHSVSLGDNNIQDISPLVVRAGNLEVLYLYNDPVTNAYLLHDFTNLFSLYLAGTPITNVNFLAGMNRLSTLTLNGDANLTNISGLVNVPTLSSLDLSSIPALDFSPVSSLVQLSSFAASNDHLASIAFVAPLTRLSLLDLGFNQFSDLSPLTGLKTNLDQLSLNNNLISNLAPLYVLTNLGYLDVSFNAITNVGPLAGLTNLSYLAIYNNRIGSIAPLAGLVKLQNLYAENNELQSVGVLTNFANLGYLNLQDNFLDTNTSSATALLIAGLQNRGAQVYFLPQSPIPYFTAAGLAGGAMQFTLNSAPGQILVVQASTNLVDWTAVTTITNTSGAFLIPNQPITLPHQFFRLGLP